MQHIPVLFQEVKNIFLSTHQKKYIVDATQGLGGHTKMLLDFSDKDSVVIGIDRDADNIDIANKNLSNYPNHISENSSFSNLEKILNKNNFKKIDFILYDLGVSSAHYDDGDRGFSIRFDGPLDMRFDRTTGKTAQDLIMSSTEDELKKIFYTFGEEKKAPFIARAIVEARKTQSIDTTYKLLEIIKKSSFDKKSPIRVFQALRIAVNDEFGHITSSLKQAIELLNIGGRIAVITFHSLEDRIVKHFFSPYLISEIDDITGQDIKSAKLKKFTKKPILPTQLEIDTNPRARSAKLRVYECIS